MLNTTIASEPSKPNRWLRLSSALPSRLSGLAAGSSTKRALSVSRKELQQRKTRKDERVDRWTAGGGKLALLDRFANVQTCRASMPEPELVVHVEPPSRGHRRTQSAPVSSQLLREIKTTAEERASRCRSLCTRKYELDAMRLNRKSPG